MSNADLVVDCLSKIAWTVASADDDDDDAGDADDDQLGLGREETGVVVVVVDWFGFEVVVDEVEDTRR